MARPAIFLLFVLLAVTACFVPSATAHPVHVKCATTTYVNPYPQAYIAQFNPADPSTWTSSLADINIAWVPDGTCGPCQNDAALDQIRTQVSSSLAPPYDAVVYHDSDECGFFP